VSEDALREGVRLAFQGRCGYCGVHESEAGSELEIDHFQPRSAGGGDDPANLVYCCTACNRHKGDFWPVDSPATAPRRLLNPRVDKLHEHLREDPDGLLVALTEPRAFHLQRLALNRPPLVALRRSRREVERLRDDLAAARREQARLQERVAALEQDVGTVLAQIARLTEQSG